MLKTIKEIYHKVERAIIKRTAPGRRKKLNNTDFTIISNNCWGGDVYRYFDLPYQSPTVGLYFWAEDYMRFVKNLVHYFQCELTFISYEESKYKEYMIEKKQTNVPIGRLDDIEIVFLHYHSEEEAREKWTRRVKRVNFDNIILKHSLQNLCTEEHLKDFSELPFNKKIAFHNKPTELPSVIYYRGYENEQSVKNDIKLYRKHMDIIEFLNEPICRYNKQLHERMGNGDIDYNP